MKRYPAADIVTFLLAIDTALQAPATLVMIGGAAAVLQHGAHRYTADIDSFSRVSKDFERAVGEARQQTGLDIHFDVAGVADAPYEYESRLERLRVDGFRKLTVLVPERHDLALMKLMRADRHDLDVIKEMHEHVPFDCDTLVERYVHEMDAAIGDPQRLDLNVVVAIEMLFGDEAAERTYARFVARRMNP